MQGPTLSLHVLHGGFPPARTSERTPSAPTPAMATIRSKAPSRFRHTVRCSAAASPRRADADTPVQKRCQAHSDSLAMEPSAPGAIGGLSGHVSGENGPRPRRAARGLPRLRHFPSSMRSDGAGRRPGQGAAARHRSRRKSCRPPLRLSERIRDRSRSSDRAGAKTGNSRCRAAGCRGRRPHGRDPISKIRPARRSHSSARGAEGRPSARPAARA